MSGVLDTSMVIRYLTGDPPELTEKAARVIDGEGNLLGFERKRLRKRDETEES